MSETSGDYGYDLVHQDLATTPVPSTPKQQPVFAVTETTDRDEDLGYDLAHEVPR